MKTRKRLLSAMVVAALILSFIPLLHPEQSYAANTRTWSTTNYTIRQGDTSIAFRSLTDAGDSTLVTIKKGSSTKYMLIDVASSGADIASKIAGKTIDTVILTHNHPDHINGLKRFEKNNVKIKKLYYNYDLSNNKNSNLGMTPYEYVKTVLNKNGVLTGTATRIRDAQNNGTSSSDSNLSGTLRISRGKVTKLASISGSGFDLYIFPPITNSHPSSSLPEAEQKKHPWYNSNNKSMLVVFQTEKDRVIFGGDIWETAMRCITNPDSSPYVKNTPNDTTSYYYGAKRYLQDNGKYTVYKASHHGTGTIRVLGNVIAKDEKEFIAKIGADVLILTGFDGNPAKYGYFRAISKKDMLMYKYFNNRFPH